MGDDGLVGAGQTGQDVGAREPGHERVGGTLEELGQAAELAQLPVRHHPDPVRERRRVAHVVRDDERREPQIDQEVLELGADDRAGVGVERGQRLVEEQDLRPARQGASERDPLALAAGDGRRTHPGEVPDAEPVEQLVDACRAAVGDVRPDRHVREQRVLLEHQADGPLLGCEVDPGAAIEPRAPADLDPPAVGPAQPRDRLEHGRLARPRGADERDRLPVDAERDLQLVRAKAEGDVELELRHERMSLYESRTVALNTTSRMPIATAWSKSESRTS